MPLSDDDIIQSNSGTSLGSTSVVVTLPLGTTAGNMLIVFLRNTGATTVTGRPANFLTAVAGAVEYRPGVPASETSWTYTLSAATDCCWVILEMSNIDPIEPYEIVAPTTASNAALGNASLTVGPSSSNYGLSTMTFAIFGCYVSSGTATKSWGSYTNGYEEIQQVAVTTGTTRPMLAVTRVFTNGAPSTHQAAATQTISTGTSIASARLAVFREAGSLISAPLLGLTGFEFGTHGGLAENTVHATGQNQPLGMAVPIPVGTWGTHYQIGSSFAGNGDYGMRIATSAATCYVPVAWITTGIGAYAAYFCPRSGSGTPTLMTWDVTTGTDLLLVYDVATSKIGLRWGAGAASWQTGTTPLDTWVWVEVRLKINATTHHAEWWCGTGTGDGSQTSPADLTGQVSTTLTKVTLSGLSSQTVTFDVDDVIFSHIYAAFPFGPHRIVRLGVDTGGTATVSGTSANFNVFTANGTLAAFNSANALAALDEVPPTVSASADGLVQVTAAASDYVELPMQDLTLAANEVIAGVRMIASMWGGTGTGTGTLGIKGYDGVTETSLAPNPPGSVYDAGSPTAISATEPLWMAHPWSLVAGNPWTLTRLNATVLRVGYSSDATPDMGVSAIYLEVAIKEIATSWTVHRLTDDEDPEVNAAVVTETLHPYNSGVRTFSVSNDDPTRTAEFNYSIGGTPQTPVVVAPSDPPVDITVGAEAFGEVDSTSFGWQ